MQRVLFVASNNSHPSLLSHIKDIEISYLRLRQRLRANRPAENLSKYLERARALIRERRIEAVYSDSDLGSLIAARLGEEFGFPGPSLESTFRCFHKLYTREALLREVRYAPINLNDPFPDLPWYPAYIKAPQSCFGVLGFRIQNQERFRELLPFLRGELRAMNAPMIALYDAYLPKHRFPLATLPLMLTEDLIQGTQVTVEGYVRNGVVRPLIIIDTNFSEGGQIFDNFSLPSRHSPATIQRLFERTERDIKMLGLDNTFFNAEYWCGRADVKLIEVNARSATCFYNLYRRSLGFDVFRAGIELALGREPTTDFTPGTTGGQFNIITTETGNSSDVLDYSLLPSLPFEHDIITKPDRMIEPRSDQGTVLVQMEIFGESYRHIREQADKWRRRLLK